MAKILVTGPPLAAPYVKALRQLGFDVINGTEEALGKLGASDGKDKRELTQEELSSLLTEVEIYIYGGLEVASGKALAQGKHLKLIAFLGTGWADEGCVDAAAVNSLGIAVTNTPGANAASVAEITIGLLIALQRKIVSLSNETKSGAGRPLKLRDISGRSLGIVGLGAIGSRVAAHARRGFNMKVVYAGPHPKPELEQELGVERVNLEQLLSTSDFVTLHSPAGSTRGLIGEEQLSLMKPAAFLINVSSPEVVDGPAVVRALQSDNIAGAAFDGYYKEPPELQSAFLALPDEKLIVLPRTAWLTEDSYGRMADMAITNIKALLEGRDLPNLVNPEHKLNPS
jgi:phosphoglycerate dehydrogenase-like enzyme